MRLNMEFRLLASLLLCISGADTANAAAQFEGDAQPRGKEYCERLLNEFDRLTDETLAAQDRCRRDVQAEIDHIYQLRQLAYNACPRDKLGNPEPSCAARVFLIYEEKVQELLVNKERIFPSCREVRDLQDQLEQLWERYERDCRATQSQAATLNEQ